MPEDWQMLIEELDAKFPTDEDLYRALAQFRQADNAFPEDLLSRGRQIFATARALTAERVCSDPRVRFMLNDSGPRTSEALTIVPLIFNILPPEPNQEASIALIALLIVRMGIGAFCRHHLPKA